MLAMKNMQYPWAYWDSRNYAILRDQDCPSPSLHTRSQGIASWSLSQILLALFLCLTSSFAGFALRDSLDEIPNFIANNDLPYSLRLVGPLIKTFEYNDTYSSAPSENSNRAWAEDLPLGKGFMVEHSRLSNISEFSVFHQLHCIDTIRHGYYAALSDTNVSKSGPDREKQAIRNKRHVAHCFDFLRQCVQCAVDTNLEPVDWSVEGVTGWGFQRVCRDFEALKKHAEKWKISEIK